MTSKELRNQFIAYFITKGHEHVPSAPMVTKNDPSLMFTNAGMNQFKDIFLGNKGAGWSRVVNSQKCLRVSGKHNDLEEVGRDTYHHTMFEMLGNWSFGDYFKKEAIAWAWEFLVKIAGIQDDRIYVTIFEGSDAEGINPDDEAGEIWKQFLPPQRILRGSKKDNFWEMGETGPCGPCSEIHYDFRDENERLKIPGENLVNKGNPDVIEIWNLVFIQYNRKANGKLELLPQKHVDTGMGFERLCRLVQKKSSNYDTDIFKPVIDKISSLTGIRYGSSGKADIAMRVLSDHLRAVSFAIADGQQPSNTGAGYVIRRILRRAIRHSYTFLKISEPFLYRLVPVLTETMGESYPELISRQSLIEKVIKEEEVSFLKTLENGIRLLDQYAEKAKKSKKDIIDGKDVFVLYDTYGFPLDLTELILGEMGLHADSEGFNREMSEQKSRSKQDAIKETGDWTITGSGPENEFVGYETLEAEIKLIRYRKVRSKDKDLYQLVFDKTPFYAESGGQVGDTGYIMNREEKYRIIDTVRENNLVIHLSEKLPGDLTGVFKATVNGGERIKTAANHTATHLLHFALRKILGTHIEQKGSLVHPDYLRFDFSHPGKISEENLREIEILVNTHILENIPLTELRDIPVKEALAMGAMALFGEKYGDKVRVIRFDESIELCGGTHVRATGEIGFFKILKESAISAGVRRIEAITGITARDYVFEQLDKLKKIAEITGITGEPVAGIEKLIMENQSLRKQVENFVQEKLLSLKTALLNKFEDYRGIKFLAETVKVENAGILKDLAYQLKGNSENMFLVLASEIDGKAMLVVMISNELVSSKGFNAALIIREISKEIEGGGGGQPFFATAGGNKTSGIPLALEKARKYLL